MFLATIYLDLKLLANYGIKSAGGCGRTTRSLRREGCRTTLRRCRATVSRKIGPTRSCENTNMTGLGLKGCRRTVACFGSTLGYSGINGTLGGSVLSCETITCLGMGSCRTTLRSYRALTRGCGVSTSLCFLVKRATLTVSSCRRTSTGFRRTCNRSTACSETVRVCKTCLGESVRTSKAHCLRTTLSKATGGTRSRYSHNEICCCVSSCRGTRDRLGRTVSNSGARTLILLNVMCVSGKSDTGTGTVFRRCMSRTRGKTGKFGKLTLYSVRSKSCSDTLSSVRDKVRITKTRSVRDLLFGRVMICRGGLSFRATLRGTRRCLRLCPRSGAIGGRLTFLGAHIWCPSS